LQIVLRYVNLHPLRESIWSRDRFVSLRPGLPPLNTASLSSRFSATVFIWSIRWVLTLKLMRILQILIEEAIAKIPHHASLESVVKMFC
jgi:hypothetical protein